MCCPGSPTSRDDGELARADLEERRDVLEFVVGREAHRTWREALEERRDSDPRDDAGERRARADVRSESEREVLVGVLSVGAEGIGFVEERLVAVRTCVPGDHALTGLDGLVPDVRLTNTPSGDEENRRRDAQALLDGVGEQLW